MALVGADLAEAIRTAMGFPSPVSQQLVGWGTGVVNHVQTAIVNHALITGDTSPGGPLANGAGVLGVISGMTGSGMASEVVNSSGGSYPFVSPELLNFCTAVVDHIQNTGSITFLPGGITGSCTSTPVSPGPLAGGAGSGGLIVGLNGSALASEVAAAVGYPGVSPELILFCSAITDYLTANAEAIYNSGSVTGTCPPGGGPLAGGVGANGIIA